MSLINKETMEKFNNRRYPSGFSPKETDLRLRIVRAMVGRDCPKRICDIGCNEGILGELLLKDGHEVFGVDISDSALETAQRRGLKIYRANLETDKLPFADESLDVVTACETIAHIYDTDRLFKEIRRVLKDGGLFIITTPNTLSLGRRLSYLFGIGAFLEASLGDKNAAGAIRFFTKDSLSALLRRHNFAPLRFTSDFVNIGSGLLRLRWLAQLFPTLGGSLIVSARKLK